MSDRLLPNPLRAGAPVVVLDAGTEDHAMLGGKGRSLARLVSAGFPVPPTAVITTVAYAHVSEDPRVAALVEQLIAGESIEEAQVADAFDRVIVPDGLAAEIARVAALVGGSHPVAVRSSATVEDLHGSSFAGQYRSILEVDCRDPEAVLTAVRDVWASLWRPAAVAYRRAFGIDDRSVAMAVVIMRMVPATTAGVIFTVDPGGLDDHARVEEVTGLGESLVSGDRTPTAWVVPRDRADDSLPPVPARALRLALEVEQHAGCPQDIEWAAVEDDVYLVQARPITVLDRDDGFDSPVDDHELTTAGIVEMVPGVLPPLRWEMNRFLLEEAFRSVLDDLGILHGDGAADRSFVRRVRGRAALDFDLLRLAAASIPGAVDRLEFEYFGSEVAGKPPVRARGFAPSAILRELRSLRTRHLVTRQADVVIETVAVLRNDAPSIEDLDDRSLVGYRYRLLDLAGRALSAELGVAAVAAATFARLEALIGQHLDAAEASRAAQALTVNAGRSRPTSAEASAAVFGGPTWQEMGSDPPHSRVLGDERSRAQADDLDERLLALPGWRRRRILTGQVIDVRLHLIHRVASDATDQLTRREDVKAAFLHIGGEVRRLHREMGRRLVARGRLNDSEDLDYLGFAEVLDLLSGDRLLSADVIGRRRNWVSRYEAEGALPVRFTGIPARTPVPLPMGEQIFGWAASPGRRAGRARTVRQVHDRFEQGEVLVAEATDASWSPLFIRAAAVVVERGGPLSHTAILARELGLPAVLNIPGATRALDGRDVLVDGDRGVVVIEPEDRS